MVAPVVSPPARETLSEGEFILTTILSRGGRGLWDVRRGTDPARANPQAEAPIPKQGEMTNLKC